MLANKSWTLRCGWIKHGNIIKAIQQIAINIQTVINVCIQSDVVISSTLDDAY